MSDTAEFVRSYMAKHTTIQMPTETRTIRSLENEKYDGHRKHRVRVRVKEDALPEDPNEASKRAMRQKWERVGK